MSEMPGDLPVYSNTMLRTGLQFADLDRLVGPDLSEAWAKADGVIAQMESARDVAMARAALNDSTTAALLKIHGILFQGRAGAGKLRSVAIPPLYRGQDCAPPEFIERSLGNLEIWLAADSFKEIHPIERCALTITRIIDIWPFEYGSLTTAIVFANLVLKNAGLAPFYVLSEHQVEFEKVIANSMLIEMQPLINAIYQTVKRGMTPGPNLAK